MIPPSNRVLFETRDSSLHPYSTYFSKYSHLQITSSETLDSSETNSFSIEQARTRFEKFTNCADLPVEKRPFVVVDNGSFECRAGWGYSPGDDFSPPVVRFRNTIFKAKTGMNLEIDGKNLVGSELLSIEPGKLFRKNMFAGDILVNKHYFEDVMDYNLAHLGFSEEVKNPIMMSEPLCNPSQSRSYTSEVLFECYDTPAVGYFVDSLAGFYHFNHLK